MRHTLCIYKHLFWVYLNKAHYWIRAVTRVCVAIFPILFYRTMGGKLIFFKCFLLHICSHVKGSVWRLNIAPEEFSSNRSTFFICVAGMWIHYLQSISIVWCHSNVLLFSSDYLSLCGGRKKTTFLPGVIILQSNCAIWLGLPESSVHSQCIETVVPEDLSIVYHSSQYWQLIEVIA